MLQKIATGRLYARVASNYKKGGTIEMKKSAFFGIIFIMSLLVTSAVFGGSEPKWRQIQWNKPQPWAERLKGIELADELPQEFIKQEPWLKDQPKKTVSALFMKIFLSLFYAVEWFENVSGVFGASWTVTFSQYFIT